MTEEVLVKKAEEYAYSLDGKVGTFNEFIKESYIAGAKVMQNFMKENNPLLKFDPSRLLTVATADRATVGMKGIFADSLAELKDNFENSVLYELVEVYSEDFTFRFKAEHNNYALFYPVEEM